MEDDLRRQQPRGVPGVSYVRVVTEGTATKATNIEVEQNIVTISSDTEPRARFDRNQFVLERGISDEEVCESTIGVQAGEGVGAALNPINAFVSDSATTLIILRYARRAHAHVGPPLCLHALLNPPLTPL